MQQFDFPLWGLLLVLITCSFGVGALLLSLVLRSRHERKEAEIIARAETEIARFEERLLSRDERVAVLSEQLRARETSQARSQEELRALEAHVAELSTRLEDERHSAKEKMEAFEGAKAALLDSFKALSADALRTNNQSFLELALQNLSKFQEGAKGEMEKKAQAIDELVRPLKESLQKVDEKIEHLEQSRNTAYVSLHEQVKALAETQMMLRSETGNLVKALRAPAVRGRWGEIQLRRVVELAGMLDHCDFFEQESMDTDEGRRRPDMVIKLPNGREITVDAKVPIEAYLRAIEAPTEELRVLHLKDHARQIRDHLNKLGQKAYYQHFESPEFTVLFLSGETFFSAALEQDPGLLEFGVERKVIIATPTTLIALLRAVYYGWRQEAIAEHARSIRELGTLLHDRLRIMTEHLVKVRRGLDTAVVSYNEFVRSFDSRVLVTARKFKELEATNGKELPELEIVPTGTIGSVAESGNADTESSADRESTIGRNDRDLALTAALPESVPQGRVPQGANPPVGGGEGH